MKVEMSLHARNAALDLLAKTGTVGTAGVVLVLLAWRWRVLRVRIWQANGDERRQTIASAHLAGYAVRAFDAPEYPLHYLYFFPPFYAQLRHAGLAGTKRLPGAGACRAGCRWEPLAGFAAVGAIVLRYDAAGLSSCRGTQICHARTPCHAADARVLTSSGAVASSADARRERAVITPANAAELLLAAYCSSAAAADADDDCPRGHG
ncbi:hypothetical protein ACTMU2_23270 [Cupriavidus basilensis]